VVTVVVLPLHAFGHAPKILDGVRAIESDNPVDQIDVELLTGFELEGFANSLGNYDLEFGRDLHSIHSDLGMTGL
jgi:hypothetical protein